MKVVIVKTVFLTISISTTLVGIAVSILMGEYLTALSFFVAFSGSLAGAILGSMKNGVEDD